MDELTAKEQEARKMVCLPLDGLATFDDAETRVKELGPVVGLFKVGKESYTRFGPDIVKMVQDHGANVFLDLKYHDIPNTVKGASGAATEKLSWVFNVHASGGRAMMEAAVEGALKAMKEYGIPKPNVIGVTVLTSIGPAEYLDINRSLVSELNAEDLMPYFGMKSDEHEKQESFAGLLDEMGYGDLTIEDERGYRCDVVEQQVLNLALMSRDCGLDGIVCSAADLHAVREHLPNDFLYVTPGIKGPNTPAGEDQARVFTPGHAVEDGSSILVIGRAITRPDTAEGRLLAGYEVLQDMAKYL
ncbi:MAG: orotidine 5'-phosphate decarboxylase / HUMPS family protein [archaeon]|nr:orotidine 5'-phosphate decarboxylase [Nanoarchaeota archaeon]